jgi:hypothetical protein
MELKPLKHAHSGSNTTHFGYDEATRTLRVKFSSGKVAEYDNVPPQLAAGLENAPSHGSFFNKHIKGGAFTWRYV